jgi:ABC-type transport system involved in cytochrome c biogenesis permease subunit
MIISHKQTFKDEAGHRQPAIKWLFDVMSGSPSADQYKVFRIESDQILNWLGLEARPQFYRYSYAELAPKYEDLMRKAAQADAINPKQRQQFDEKVLELAQHVRLYERLQGLVFDMTPPMLAMKNPQRILLVPPQAAGDEWEQVGVMNARAALLARQRLEDQAKQSGTDLEKVRDAKGLQEFGRALTEVSPASYALVEMVTAYRRGDAKGFNQAVAGYPRYLAHVPQEQLDRSNFEVFFNHFEPFYLCSVLYVVVALLAFASWLGWSEPLMRAAFWLGVLTLVIHTLALGARMYIQDRLPPVTNLYSSAVFVGWGAVGLGLCLEAWYRNSLGTVVAAVLGSMSMVVAHHLAETGDTLQMMQAVLDTNFWLATHVVIINIGYVATFVAGVLGVLYILLGVLTTRLTRDLAKTLTQMIYGVICFAILMSFTGTVLGGLWADQSWGRFWGWDPKENGALMIVLANALLLHARWGGLVKQRGIALLAILGNIVTAWSYFGTNQLGVGLHAYGFNSTLAVWLRWFWVSQLAFIALGSLPLKYWRSFAALPQAAPKAAHPTPGRRKLGPVPAN